MLRVESLACQRGGRRLFEHLRFEVHPGELLHIQGANGSGKTSLLRILAGLSIQDAGCVRWQDSEITQTQENYAARLLYLGHHPAVKDDLSVQENLLISLKLAGLAPSATEINSALDIMGLSSRAKLPARVLSQGQRRRLALSRLWLDTRPLWLLDEPFTALDVHATATLEQRLEQHLANNGMVVLTTHQKLSVSEQYLRILNLGL
jgi:heme exporter protein A